MKEQNMKKMSFEYLASVFDELIIIQSNNWQDVKSVR